MTCRRRVESHPCRRNKAVSKKRSRQRCQRVDWLVTCHALRNYEDDEARLRPPASAAPPAKPHASFVTSNRVSGIGSGEPADGLTNMPTLLTLTARGGRDCEEMASGHPSAPAETLRAQQSRRVGVRCEDPGEVGSAVAREDRNSAQGRRHVYYPAAGVNAARGCVGPRCSDG
jgi:hypothetical protein